MIQLLKCNQCWGSGMQNPEFVSLGNCERCGGFGMLMYCKGERRCACLRIDGAISAMSEHLGDQETDAIIYMVKA